MKRFIPFFRCILVGFAAGWYFGYTRPTAKADREVREQLREIEVDECSAALFALKAIPIVQAGDAQKAALLADYVTNGSEQGFVELVR